MTALGMSRNAAIAGQVVVVCGASSGCGRGAALDLARRGARVALMARRARVLDDLEAEIRSFGGTAIAVPGDLSDPAEVAWLARMAQNELGPIDTWINSVGIGALGFFWDIPVQDQARLVDVNLKGLVLGSHAAMVHFVQRGQGRLINIGSLDCDLPLACQAAYAATQAGVLSLGRSLREELRLAGLARRITVSTLMPGAVDTPWWTHAANYTGHAPQRTGFDDPGVMVEAIRAACMADFGEDLGIGARSQARNWMARIFPGLSGRHRLRPPEVAGHSGALHRPLPVPQEVPGASATANPQA